MALIGLFPGQGSQVVGMGKDLAESFDQAKIMFQMADKALGFPLSKLAFEGPIEELTLTKNAQPAILCVSVCAHLLSNPPLDVVAGHSLGEYSALVATGSITFEDAVQLVHKRGSYMQEAVPEGEGAMVAVMGPTPDELGAIVDQISDEIIELANLNCPGQTVVSGSAKGVAAFSEKAQASGAKVIPLQVSAPFHSTLMKPAAESLAKDLSARSIVC